MFVTAMKKIILIITIMAGLISSASAQTANSTFEQPSRQIYQGMHYPQYAKLYDSKMYVPQFGDPYNSGTCGVLSALIPGLGQGLAGEWGRGGLIFAGNLLLGLACMQMIDVRYANGAVPVGISGSAGTRTTIATIQISPLVWLLSAARLGLQIYSIWDAVHIAKIKNMYYQDLRNSFSGVNLSLEPFLSYTPTQTSGYDIQPAAGFSFKLNF